MRQLEPPRVDYFEPFYAVLEVRNCLDRSHASILFVIAAHHTGTISSHLNAQFSNITFILCMSPVSPVFHTEVKVSIGLKTSFRISGRNYTT